MSFKDLREFIAYLEQKNQLVRIKEEVSSYLEITEIHQRVIKNGGPALLFENVITENGKSKIPVLVNLFGTIDRVAYGLNTTKDKLRDFGELLAFLKQPEPPRNLKETWSMLPLAKKILAMKPKIVSKASVHEIVLLDDDVDLNILPIQTCWPDEPAPLITWPLVVTKGPTSSKIDDYNLGIYRMQLLSKNKTLMRWLKHRGGANHHQRWSKLQDKPLPAAIVIGCDPATIIAAVTPVPDNLSEYQFAGLIRGKSTELVDCKTIPIQVPANAEIVIEGYVSLNDYQDEGPYGDHTGYYNSVEKFPSFTATAITMRKDPVYLSTFTARPPDEPSILGEALNEIFIPLIIQQFPEIVDFWLPPEACSYRIAIVSINKTYPGQAKRIMMGVWSYLRQFLYTKFIIIVDKNINCRDWKDVMWAVSTKMDFARDSLIMENTPIDYLDFASLYSGLGGKIGFDATDKIPPETNREWGKEIYMKQYIIDLVNNKWQKYNIPE